MAETYNLARFGLRDMVACSATLRQLGDGAKSIEDAAERSVRWLYDHLVDDVGEHACALVRLFQTRPAPELPPDMIRAAGLPQSPPPIPCLVLLATAGQLPEWNSPLRSSNHRAIALSDSEAVGRAPMIAQLLKQFGVSVAALLNPNHSLLMALGEHTFNVFYVPAAAGSPWVPAQQDFVLRYGIRSVVGFGAVLPDDSLFALILFAKVPISQAAANQFRTLALSVKLALVPFAAAVITKTPG